MYGEKLQTGLEGGTDIQPAMKRQREGVAGQVWQRVWMVGGGGERFSTPRHACRKPVALRRGTLLQEDDLLSLRLRRGLLLKDVIRSPFGFEKPKFYA